MIQKTRNNKVQLAYFTFLIIGLLTLAFSSNPPDGRTGAPGEGLCSNCHNQSGTPIDGNVTVNFPTSIDANQTYTLTITSNNPNGLAQLAGFQMTILDGNNDQAGTMTNPSSSSVVTNSGMRQYHEHNPAQPYVGTSTSVSWTVDWTAPSGPDMEQITFYTASMIANGMNGNSGDLLVQATGSGTLSAAADPLSATIASSSDVTCFDGSDGSAEGDAAGGTMPYTYSWSNGANTQIVSNFSSGNYILTVTDMTGATATASVTIDEPDEIINSGSIISDVSCANAADGSINLQVAGGDNAFIYSWSNGSTLANINNLSAAFYSVTVTDGNGCTNNFTFQIQEPPLLSTLLVSQQNVLCNGDLSGSATFDAAGGTPPFTFAWSNGFNGPTQTGLIAGNYNVVVTDNNGCTNLGIVTITEPPLLEISQEVVDDAFCFGQSTGGAEVSVNGGFGDLDVQWSNGQSGTTILNLPADTYVATVTDENGCTALLSVEVGQPDELVVSIESINQISCAGANDGSVSISVTGGTPNVPPGQYSILWSNGESGFSNDSLSPGNYTINVEDVNVCMASISFEIIDPVLLEGTTAGTDETAPGLSDGSATISVTGGTMPYTYLWSNGATTSSISGLGTGTFTVVVTDANGCTTTGSYTVMSAGCTLTATMNVVDVLCFGELTGEASVNVMDQNEPVEVLWSTGETGITIGSLPAGPYSATITDASNCSFTVSGTISQPEALTIQCNTTDESAEGANDGTATCSTIGGVPDMQYQWSTGDTTSSLSNLAPGEYGVTVTDGNGCAKEAMVTINAFVCNIQYNITSTDVLCFSQSNGMAMVNLNGPAQVLWSTGSVQTMVNGLAPGQYFVTITESAGCSTVDSVLIIEPTHIVATVDSITNASLGLNDGGIFISVTGGVPPYQYSWVLDNTQISTQEDPDSLAAGIYQINVIDATGCVGGQSDIVVSTTTNIPLLDAGEWNVFPNPANNLLNIDYLNSNAELEIEHIHIFDINGQMKTDLSNINSFTRSKQTIDISNLHGGFYTLVIVSKNGRYIKRFVKM